MYVLFLNDMRQSKSEFLEPVARSESPDDLIALLENNKSEPYRDVETLK